MKRSPQQEGQRPQSREEDSAEEVAGRPELCPDNPASTAGSDDGGCPQCRGALFLFNEKKQMVPCGCTVETRVRAHLPKRYWSAGLTSFSDRVMHQVLAWTLDPRDGLRITGPAGTGKTFLAAALVRHRWEQGEPALFRPLSSIYREMRECYSAHKSEKEYLARLFNAPFLVLDDLGAGGLSDFERRTVLEILDERLNECRPTVVTSNWTLQDISDRMDERIASRLAGFALLELHGADRRLYSAKLGVNIAPPKSISAGQKGAK